MVFIFLYFLLLILLCDMTSMHNVEMLSAVPKYRKTVMFLLEKVCVMSLLFRHELESGWL